MQELRFVAVSEDGRYAVLAVPGRSARFTLPIDERLRAVALGQTSRLAQYEIEVESPLRPKEIQARIRAGETVEEIADAAGIAAERVRWFEGPVLAERAYVAEQAQTASVRRPGESTPGPRLGEITAERLSLAGADPDDVQWDARKRGDGNWQVQLTFTSGGRLHVAEWLYDPRRRHVIPSDEAAARMSLPGSELPEPVGPAPGEATVTRLAPRIRHEAPAPVAAPAATPVPPPSAPAASPAHAGGSAPPVAARATAPAARVAPAAPSTPAAAVPAEPVRREAPAAQVAPAPAPETPAPETRTPQVPAPEVPAQQAAAPEAPAPQAPAPSENGRGRHAAEATPAAREVAAEAAPAAPAPREAAAEQPAAEARETTAAEEPAAAPAAEAVQQPPAEAPAAPAASAPKTPNGNGTEQAARSGRKNARGRRSSVPSWDEIMLGSSRQRD